VGRRVVPLPLFTAARAGPRETERGKRGEGVPKRSRHFCGCSCFLLPPDPRNPPKAHDRAKSTRQGQKHTTGPKTHDRAKAPSFFVSFPSTPASFPPAGAIPSMRPWGCCLFIPQVPPFSHPAPPIARRRRFAICRKKTEPQTKGETIYLAFCPDPENDARALPRSPSSHPPTPPHPPPQVDGRKESRAPLSREKKKKKKKQRGRGLLLSNSIGGPAPLTNPQSAADFRIFGSPFLTRARTPPPPILGGEGPHCFALLPFFSSRKTRAAESFSSRAMSRLLRLMRLLRLKRLSAPRGRQRRPPPSPHAFPAPPLLTLLCFSQTYLDGAPSCLVPPTFWLTPPFDCLFNLFLLEFFVFPRRRTKRDAPKMKFCTVCKATHPPPPTSHPLSARARPNRSLSPRSPARPPVVKTDTIRPRGSLPSPSVFSLSASPAPRSHRTGSWIAGGEGGEPQA